MDCTKNNFAYPNVCQCDKCIAFRNDIKQEALPTKNAIAVFNDGNSCFVIDDGCYVLKNNINGEWVNSFHIFKEAARELIKLNIDNSITGDIK